ncbi:MAG: hypothetical protein SFU86_24820 [Pirellulaceae bacterium]|nr:hypothetical protein [Pirellulaceae bacterium]
MIHLRRYFVALAAVLLLYGGYAYGVAPLMAPPPAPPRSEVVPLPPLAETGTTRVDFAQLFPPGSWELDKPKVVETEQAILLIKDYKPTPDGKLELNPCTLIFFASAGPAAPGQPATERPIILQAPAGAMLQFDRPLNIAKAQFGQLTGGRLEGEITIRGPESAPGANDALLITTRNVQLDRQRVFTPHDVNFTYGSSFGSGRDLTIALLPENPDAPSGQAGIGGIRSLALARLDRLHIETGGANILPGKAGMPGGPAASGPVEVTCRGPFLFDFLERVAMFDDAVEVQKLNPAGPPDMLRGERLLLYFAGPATAKTKPAAGEPTDSQPAARGKPAQPAIERIVATGSPVTLVAPSSATSVSGAKIDYSLAKRRLALVPSESVRQVSLRQEQGEFVARELEYEMAERGKLGLLWAAGPGELTMVQVRGGEKQTLVARWNKELRIRPQDAGHVISLLEMASITAEPQGRFAADELHLWVREVPAPPSSKRAERSPPTPEVSAELTPAAAAETKTMLIADRLLATGQVVFDSPQLHAETAELKAWFQQVSPEALAAGPASDSNRPRNPPRQPTADPRRLPPEPAADAAPTQHFTVRGGTMQMQVIMSGPTAQLEDLTIEGRVEIDETRTAEAGQLPVRVRGDVLTLRGGTTPQSRIDVVGKPAEVSGRGLTLAGGAVHLARAENRVWIDGPGEARLPIPSQSPGPGLPAPPPQMANVVWQREMNFDGQTVEVGGEVQVRTPTQTATCETLAAALAKRIDFAAPQTDAPAELARLALDGGVFAENNGLDERGQRVSLDQLQVKNLVLDRAADTIRAEGPGWVSTTRLGSAAAIPGSPPPPLPMPTAPGQPLANVPPALTYVHIAFEGGIGGSISQRRIEFQKQVRTTYAPVTDWNQRVVAERLSDLGERGVLLTSAKLTVIEMLDGRRRWIETQASGNAVVEAATFTVQAPLISFSSDKEVLTLEGDGHADAELWYRTIPGEPSSYAAARKWRYWLRTGMFDVEDARVFDLNNPGGKFRLPGGRR